MYHGDCRINAIIFDGFHVIFSAIFFALNFIYSNKSFSQRPNIGFSGYKMVSLIS